MSEAPFTAADLLELRGQGIEPEEALRQLLLLEHPPGYLRLARPCTPGDGIATLSEAEAPELIALHGEMAAAGRCLKFVPASGAATRMFRDLTAFHGSGSTLRREEVAERAARGDKDASELLNFLSELRRFAFHDDLQAVLADRGEDLARVLARGRVYPILDALLSRDGLGYAELPKGLLKFHRYPEGSRTAFEEHLEEAAGYVKDEGGLIRLHLTVSPEHLDRFRALIQKVGRPYEARHNARYEVGFSTQEPSTDTLAVDLENRPFRDESGRLVFRPAGHGALLRNLHDLNADIVFIKNIDNVCPDRDRETTVRWKKLLSGYLLHIQREIFRHIGALRDRRDRAASSKEALRFAMETLHMSLPGGAASLSQDELGKRLLDALDRPIRVCGVVRNTGEPGGGPFWVRGEEGSLSLQIVESAQVAPRSSEQQAIFKSSTHFNPVDLVCALRDADGDLFDLHRHVDPDAVIVATKSFGGRELRALERPGLWNGAMARWITFFVEVPGETFTPVKTVHDLLRPEHQTEA